MGSARSAARLNAAVDAMIAHVMFAKDDNDLVAQKINSFPLLVGATSSSRTPVQVRALISLAPGIK
jgi:hypothetical protein